MHSNSSRRSCSSLPTISIHASKEASEDKKWHIPSPYLMYHVKTALIWALEEMKVN